jgi:hypothetical protein
VFPTCAGKSVRIARDFCTLPGSALSLFAWPGHGRGLLSPCQGPLIFPVDTHSLEVLELHKIIALAARKAQSLPGREATSNIRPLTDPRVIERELLWTAELREILASSDVPVLDFPDSRAQLEKVHVEGSVLEARELLEVLQTQKSDFPSLVDLR